MLRPGMFLQDRYEILEKIGSGGMSDVYKAKCHKLNRPVAIKVLKEEFSSDANFVSKFKMEAQAAARLSHPNIVNVYDVIDEGNIHYIVMELIEGITLKNYIAKKGRLDIKESIGIAIQVAQGIAAAHDQHIVHRDIKPQNMIISKDGKVKVADFGIARAVSAQTLNSSAMGSVHYISPEQARGGFSDARSDIYSMGITMYEMLTGRVPFEGDNTVSIALAHLEDPIVPPASLNPEIPVSLESIILKCTEKKPERRYNSANEVISDLRKALVSPDDDFVEMAPAVDSSQTVIISPEELGQIRDGRRSENRAVRRQAGSPLTEDYQDDRYGKEIRNQKKSGKLKKDPDSDHDIDPKIEKLLTGVGVAMAIVIIAVLIFVISKLSGVFGSGSSGKETIAEAMTAIETTLSEKEILMPDVLGLTEDIARAKLKEDSLDMKISGYEFSENYEKDTVMSQNVAKGEVVNKYSAVSVIISKGTENPDIDLTTMNLVDMDAQAAKLLLQSEGFIIVMEKQNNDAVAQGKVINFTPNRAKSGDTVTLYVSDGPLASAVQVAVPDLKNQTKEKAEEMLVSLGLVSGVVTSEPSNTIPSGSIISQSIAAGTMVDSGWAVDYTVSSGPEDKGYKYLASIDTTFPLQNVIGPGASATNLTVKVRLKQTVNGREETRDLIGPVNVNATVILPINIKNIEGAYGVTSGIAEVVNVDNDEVLTSYPLTFIAVPQ